MGQWTLRPLERGRASRVLSVCVCGGGVVQGVSLIVVVRRRGWFKQDRMLLGPVSVF